jgi:glucan endo-1,3-alpha-glucosidase
VELQWKSIVRQQPDWVEIVTWNDFAESYICPVAAHRLPESVPPWLKSKNSHAGYLELTRYYIDWYKTGRQPPLKDSLFWFYRVHPKGAVAKDDRPVKALHGDVQDVVYLTAMMTAPAELRVTSGRTTTVHPLAAGIQHLRVPFRVGAQRFAVYRGGKEVVAGDGDPIKDRIDRYDFFPISGFAYGR